MKNLKTAFTFTICLGVVLSLQACAGMQLTPITANPSEISGTYTLILYGCHYPDDVQNMALLIDEKNEHPVDIYALDDMYKTKKGLTGSEALSEANKFITCSTHTVWQTVLRKIADDNNRTIGYELKPLYRTWEFGVPEVLFSSYSLKNGIVTAYIRLEPGAWLNVYGGGGGGDFSGSDSH
ncbi:MAG TPA: hypothetical protein VLX29_10485 [Nitrospirota bacterium]|nr:hypothetical protein [Nitrospirota bacterium]